MFFSTIFFLQHIFKKCFLDRQLIFSLFRRLWLQIQKKKLNRNGLWNITSETKRDHIVKKQMLNMVMYIICKRKHVYIAQVGLVLSMCSAGKRVLHCVINFTSKSVQPFFFVLYACNLSANTIQTPGANGTFSEVRAPNSHC